MSVYSMSIAPGSVLGRQAGCWGGWGRRGAILCSKLAWSRLAGEEALFPIKACHRCRAAVVKCVGYQGTEPQDVGEVLREGAV